MVDHRERRIAQNEALFREINDRLEQLNEAFSTFTGTMTIVCECGDENCLAQIEIPAQEYARVREDSTRFIIVPGHEAIEVEAVVEQHPTYDVLKKRPGAPAEFARATDPRQ